MEKYKDLIPYVIIVVLLILLTNQLETTNKITKEKESAERFLTDSLTYYKSKLGNEIASRSALKGDRDQLALLLSKAKDSNGQLKDLLSRYKNVDAAGNVSTITKFDTVYIEYDEPIPFEFNKEWEKVDKWYYISGTSNQFGNTINKLEVPANISFAIGDKKKGLFKTDYLFEATVDNPNVKINELDGYSVSVKNNRLVVVISAGYGFNGSGFGFVAGVGLGYTLLSL